MNARASAIFSAFGGGVGEALFDAPEDVRRGASIDSNYSWVIVLVRKKWTGEGRAAVGTVRDLAAQSVHLPGMTDSESDGDRRDEHPGPRDPDNGGPGDEPEEDE
jgi:hypothetical protein